MADSLQNIDKRCKYCGKEFVKTKNYKQVYCSKECRDRYWNDINPRENNEKTCIVCEKKFIVKYGHVLTCSKECSKERRRYLKSAEYKNLHTDFENKRKHNTEYITNRLKTDPEFKTLHTIRSRFRMAVKGLRRSKGIKSIIGCSLEELLLHLQSTAISNGYTDFNINNYDGKKYHIDHIKPCSSFNFTKENEITECFNYNNLQVLLAADNLKKSNKYTEDGRFNI